MNEITPMLFNVRRPERKPLNLSRRNFLGASLGALVLGATLPVGRAMAQAAAAPIAPGTRVRAFLEIRPNSTVLFRSPFIEGGQGIFTAMAQIVGEELDVDPAQFVVEGAPPGPDYVLIGGNRFTGGSFSVRSSYDAMRRLGASARQMLLQAAARRLGVRISELTTKPGRVLHAASGRSIAYGEIAAAAAKLKVPDNAPLRARADFRWIGNPVPRLDVRDKSTGRARYTIDLSIEGMLHAAVQHSPRLGGQPGALTNEGDVQRMPGIHSIHKLPGAVAVLATSGWRGSPSSRGATGDVDRGRPWNGPRHACRFLVRSPEGDAESRTRRRD
jgi:isoquinoline 1-oxidoreductase beta subunit